mgnify:CR=1 FL=1
MALYELIVGNIGLTWHGTNGAQALREYGAARESARKPGGRDGWETVTLMRDSEPVREFQPGPFFLVELTDTFGGDANYSWVTRVKVQARNIKHAARRFASDAGYSGRVRCDYAAPDELGTTRYNIRGAALCFFVCHWSDEYHSELCRMGEL